LSVSAALFSSVHDIAISSDVVMVGEVGLAGEVRRVPQMERRLSEAARLGFRAALVPPGVECVPAGFRTIVIPHVRSALEFVREWARKDHVARDERAQPSPVRAALNS
jgi:DNA repair protein RadA/Sms